MKKTINIVWILLLITAISSCNKKKVGDVTIEAIVERSEITIDNFPQPTVGVEGFNTISYPNDFSFKETDEAIYSLLTSTSFNSGTISIKLRNLYKDKYGKDSLGHWMDIGTISKDESEKYADFNSWNSNYGLFKFIRLYSPNKSMPVTSDNVQSSMPANEGKASGTMVSADEERLSEYNPVVGENTTDYNQTDYNLKKLNWREIEDVFFKLHLEFYETGHEVVGFKGIITAHSINQNVGLYDVITLLDNDLGMIKLYYHSLHSGKSIMRPSSNINIGDQLEGWGAKLVYEGQTVYYLNQAILKEQ